MRKQRIVIKKKRTTVDESSVSFVAEKDYTQVYDVFSHMSVNINSGTSYKLLFWLLAYKATQKGSVQIDSVVFQDFNEYLADKCGPDCTIVRSTFDKCIAELKEAGALTMLTKGHYQANAFGFWRGSVKDRTQFLSDQQENAKYSFYNPDHDTKLLD